MLERFSLKLTEIAIERNIITLDEKELYTYAYQKLISFIATFATTILIGIITDNLLGLLIFTLFFMPLRIYSGGLHLSTYFRCYLGSVGVMLLAVLACNSLAILFPTYVFFIILGFSAFIIFKLAPISHPNKPLNDVDTAKYRFKARFILSVEIITISIVIFFNVRKFVLFAISGVLFVAILLVINPRSR